MTLPKLLAEWNRLNNEEMELDKRCGQILSFFFCACSSYLKMLGVGVVAMMVLSIESTFVLWVSLGTFVMVVATGIGSGALMSLLKIKSMQWSFVTIDRRMEELANDIRDFNAANGNENTRELAKKLGVIDHHRGRFRKYNLVFLGLTYFCSLLCLMSLLGCVYVMLGGFAT